MSEGFPTSKTEHFKKENMEKLFPKYGIKYIWLGKKLGGYRHGGYKRHMQTKIFREGTTAFRNCKKQAHMPNVYGDKSKILS